MSHPRFNNSKAEKAANELYPTPPDFTRALLDNWVLPRRVWEPAAGRGDMVRVLEERGHEVVATDLMTGQDFFLTPKPEGVGAIVTNPPFSLGMEWAERSTSLCPVVALILPLYALGGTQRATRLWKSNPPTLVIVIPWRMQHETGTSHFNHMWVVWDRTQDTRTTEMVWATP